MSGPLRQCSQPRRLIHAGRRACLAAVLAGIGCSPPAPGTSAPPTPHPPADRFVDPCLVGEKDGGLYLAAVERTARGSHLYLATSPDHGESWRVLPPLANAAPGIRRRPQLAAGARGECYVLWEDTREDGPGLWFNATRDGGFTWLPADLHIDTGGGTARPAAPALACDDRGNLVVAWLDRRDGFDALYVNTSRDHGFTWLPMDQRVGSLGIGRRSRLQLVCDLEGNVYALWIEETGGRRRLSANSSSDHGTTWQFEDVDLGAGPYVAGAAIVASESQTAMVAWLETDADASRISAVHTADRGRTWQPAPFASPARQGLVTLSLPRLATGHGLQTYLAWHALGGDGSSQIRLRVSPDGGMTSEDFGLDFTQPIGAAAFAPDRRWLTSPFAMEADGSGNLYLAWVQGVPGAATIGFARMTAAARDWTPFPAGPESAGREPRDAGAPLLAADDFGHVCLVWNQGGRLHVAASPFYGESGWRYTDL